MLYFESAANDQILHWLMVGSEPDRTTPLEGFISRRRAGGLDFIPVAPGMMFAVANSDLVNPLYPSDFPDGKSPVANSHSESGRLAGLTGCKIHRIILRVEISATALAAPYSGDIEVRMSGYSGLNAAYESDGQSPGGSGICLNTSRLISTTVTVERNYKIGGVPQSTASFSATEDIPLDAGVYVPSASNTAKVWGGPAITLGLFPALPGGATDVVYALVGASTA